MYLNCVQEAEILKERRRRAEKESKPCIRSERTEKTNVSGNVVGILYSFDVAF